MKIVTYEHYVGVVRNLDLSWLRMQKFGARLTPWKTDDRLAERVLHGCIGLCTESAELLQGIEESSTLNRVNIVEELGDLCWYCCVILDAIEGNGEAGQRNAIWSFAKVNLVVGTQSTGSVKDAISIMAKQIVYQAGSIIDLEKRRRYYTIPIDPMRMKLLVENLMTVIVHLGAQVGVDLPKIVAVNVAKLAARFPDKFKRSSAEIRDLTAEVDIMKRTLEQ